MSATNRGAVRNKDDFYATPAWCVRVWKQLIDCFSSSPVYVRRFIWDANSGCEIEVLVESGKIIAGMRLSEAQKVLERRAMKWPRFLRNWYLRRHAWLLN